MLLAESTANACTIYDPAYRVFVTETVHAFEPVVTKGAIAVYGFSTEVAPFPDAAEKILTVTVTGAINPAPIVPEMLNGPELKTEFVAGAVITTAFGALFEIKLATNN
jgi:hypothetical protein